MAARRKSESDDSFTRPPPATTPEARESQLIAAAVNLAEEQMLKGTASSQVITHYLKLGSTREKLEQQRLENENQLLRAKVEQIESGKKIEALYGEAIAAMRRYQGEEDIEEDYDD